jgi:hypothetical protein
MVLTDKAFFVAGPPRFSEQEVTDYLKTSRTDSFRLDPLLKDALDKFQGRKGGILLAIDKTTGETLAEFELPSPPVFDGMIATAGRLYLTTADGRVLCMGKKQ